MPSLREQLEQSFAAADEEAAVAESTNSDITATTGTASEESEEIQNTGTEDAGTTEEAGGPETNGKGQQEESSEGVKTEESDEDPTATEYPAPKSWKPVVRAEWDKLPTSVKAEVTRREKQIMHEFGVNNEARQVANAFARAVQPYQARITALNISPVRAVEELLRADHLLSTSPPQQRARYMAHLIKQYAVDIRELDSALAGEAPDGQTSALEQMLQQRLAPIQQLVQQQQQMLQQQRNAQQQEAVTSIQAMAADTKKYPYFEDVRQDMADLMEVSHRRGRSMTPEEAYHAAVKINPDTAPLVAKQQQQQRQQQQTAAARAAKKASLSVAGSVVSQPGGSADNSLRGALEAAVAQASGR